MADEETTGDDELGWPIRNDEGEVVLARAELFRTISWWSVFAATAVSINIARLGWAIVAKDAPAWPMHIIAAMIAWLCFAIPITLIGRMFAKVISLMAAEDNATEVLRALRKRQEIEDRQRHEQAKEWIARKDESRARGREIARDRAERQRLLEGQQEIERQLGD